MSSRKKVGIVVSDKAMNTRIVAVNDRIPHKKYGKVITRTKRYIVADSNCNSRMGDKVQIKQTKPLSKTKKWIIINILGNLSI